MPFRSRFDCLWCGRPWHAAGEGDLTGWAGLCPDCLDRAQDNSFLRFRLRSALRERSAGPAPAAPTTTATVATTTTTTAATTTTVSPLSGPTPAVVPGPRPADGLDAEMIAYYAARAPEYDDWYLRRGRYSRGAARDLAWHMELDAATTWLDAQPFAGAIVELAAGTGWWSPLLAGKGELSLYDANEAPLDLARDRLVAHRLRAHIHVRDAWDEPERQVDGVFCGFWLSHVPDGRLDAFLGLVRRWLRPGGLFAFIDSLPDPESGPVDRHPSPTSDEPEGVQERRLADGRRFRVVKVVRTAEAYADRLAAAGFVAPAVTTTGRFFVLGSAQAAP